jgi:Fe2+ transport system protein FeoA
MSERVPLSRVPVGGRCTIVTVGEAVRAELEREGLLPGSEVVVASRTPFGGPMIVELGRARLALAVSVAAQVEIGTQPRGPRR